MGRDTTACCIVGGGPAGAVLGLLLARHGVQVVLLERHGDFDRDFRGDTIHPSTMEVLAQVGLAEALLALPHAKIRTAALETPSGRVELADFGRLSTPYPYITMLPQVHFLELVTAEASRLPSFRLPREERDGQETGTVHLRSGSVAIMLDRGPEWQIALVIPKGSFQGLRERGMEALRERIARAVPPLSDRVAHLREWSQVSLLSVAADRVRRWYAEGLLLIGDAAHVMSPVGGVGINYAIQDAVEAANVLIGPLRERRLEIGHLAEVQRRREWPTRVIQAFQAVGLSRVVGPALAQGEASVPLPLRILPRVPLLRDLLARLIAYGVRPARLEEAPAAAVHA